MPASLDGITVVRPASGVTHHMFRVTAQRVVAEMPGNAVPLEAYAFYLLVCNTMRGLRPYLSFVRPPLYAHIDRALRATSGSLAGPYPALCIQGSIRPHRVCNDAVRQGFVLHANLMVHMISSEPASIMIASVTGKPAL